MAFKTNRLLNGLLGIAMASFLAACGKSESPEARSGKVADDSNTILQAHWLGAKHAANDTNAASFVKILEMPESKRLMAQTLDKLALAPWRMLNGWPTNSPTTNHAATLIRPLLGDLFETETQIALGRPNNQQVNFFLALRLDPARAQKWDTNLFAALRSLFGEPGKNTGAGWNFSKNGIRAEFANSGPWTCLAFANDGGDWFRAQVGLLKPEPGTQPLEAQVNLEKMSQFLGVDLSKPFGKLPLMKLAAKFEKGAVRSSGTLHFDRKLNLDLTPWQIPTNLISDPVVSFTAVRGIREVLNGLREWHALPENNTPDQLFAWSMAGSPIFSYLAVPVKDAKGALTSVGGSLSLLFDPILKARGAGRIESSPTNQAYLWAGFPFVAPSLSVRDREPVDFLLAGLGPVPGTNRPAPSQLFASVQNRPKLVYYDWEITAAKIRSWIYVAQLARLYSGRSQLPLQGVATLWLTQSGESLVNCVTVVEFASDRELNFVRHSTIGLSGAECHLLMDWFESPAFPKGTFTGMVPKAPSTLIKTRVPGGEPISPGQK